MTGGTNGDDRPYYGRARIAGGLILLGVGALLTVIDAISKEYSADQIVLGLMFGTGSVLLGVETIARRINGGS